MDEIGIGLVGTGAMAATMAAAIAAQDGLRLAAVLSADRGRADAFARPRGAAAHADPAAFYAEPGVGAVYVAGANPAHAAAAQAAIAAGKPVLVEKPLTVAAPETETVLDAAAAQGVLVMENLWILCLPAYRALKDRAAAGDLGPPTHLAFDFSLAMEPAAYPGLFRAGGGAILDRAGYGLATALDLLGPINGLDARVQRSAEGVPLRAAIQTMHGAATAHVTVALDGFGANRIDLSFARGHARLGPPSLGAEHLSITAAQPLGPPAPPGTGLKARLKRAPRLRHLRARAQGPVAFHPYGNGPYGPVLAHFAELVRAGATESPLIPPSLSRAAAHALDSAANGL